MNIKKLSDRVDQLIELGNEVLKTRYHDNGHEWVDSGKIKGFRAACLSFIEMLFGTAHTYYKEFNNGNYSARV